MANLGGYYNEQWKQPSSCSWRSKFLVETSLWVAQLTINLFFSTFCVLWVIPAEQTALNFSQAALKIDWATSGKWRNAGLVHRLIAQVHIVSSRCWLDAWIDNLGRGVGRWCSLISKKMDAFFTTLRKWVVHLKLNSKLNTNNYSNFYSFSTFSSWREKKEK